MKRDYRMPVAKLIYLTPNDLIRTSGENGDCWMDDCFEPLYME